MTRAWRAAVVATGLPLALFVHAAPQGKAQAEGLQAWQTIESVITHPRCVNCHTVSDYPRQGDERRRHDHGVTRGADNAGAPAARCSSCHAGSNHAPSGTPGHPAWHLAPLGMAWETRPGEVMRGTVLCRRLKDTRLNGGFTPEKLVEHHETEPLVRWAWQPGVRSDGTPRATPPVSHQALVDATRRWAEAGAPCPTR